ncbi:pentatricopeptide repeat-containing protein At4g39620, chloroplastic-like [Mangifera indica]|uniref:pentatricopeptide repeat-containing protein At4g39620, chloroplastic-like n=1 Tax=Mangifera indica TaxID=29780 RepID=UPI001CF9B80C|nr:pentatricopeptide repeat-containing protein At4g39620, chloroplastic-like [Mangifera indica]
MGKKGQTRMAMWLFSEMRNSGCRPDTSVYNALITAHLHTRDKGKALAKALGYFEKMKGMERCQPSIVTYNILLRAFAQARNVAQVNALFKELDESFLSPDIYTYNGVMDAYRKNGMIREMEDILSRMKRARCKPDIITFNLLIDSYGKKQAFDKIEQVFKSLSHSRENPTLPTFNSMIINYGKARLRGKAEDIFLKMADMKYKRSFITYESLITILPVEADALFDNLHDLKVTPDLSTYRLLYKAYTKVNMKYLVQKLLKRMERDGIVPNKRFFLEALETFGSKMASPESASAKMIVGMMGKLAPDHLAVERIVCFHMIWRRIFKIGIQDREASFLLSNIRMKEDQEY